MKYLVTAAALLLAAGVETYLHTHTRSYGHYFHPRLRTVDTPAKYPLARSLLNLAYPGKLDTPAGEEQRVADRALLIRRASLFDQSTPGQACRSLPSTLGPWTFENVMKLAFRFSGVESRTDEFITRWVNEPIFRPVREVWPTQQGVYATSSAPFRTLGIVNRMDLGKVRNHRIGDAEIRFVFAAIPAQGPGNDPFFTAIVEFVLKPMDKQSFRDMAREWLTLTKANDHDYPEALKKVVLHDLSGTKQVRLRSNLMTIRGTTWTFRQFAFSAGGLTDDPLDDQTKYSASYLDKCVGDDQGDAKTQELTVDMQKEIRSNSGNILNNRFSWSKELGTDEASIQWHSRHVLTLAPKVVDSGNRERTRFALSINSCVGCHSWETQAAAEPIAPFDQIKYRECGADSELSGFLAGNPGSTPTRKMWRITPPRAKCLQEAQDESEADDTYSYNDLVRRDYYLHTVAYGLRACDSDDVWREKLEKPGLTAFQVH